MVKSASIEPSYRNIKAAVSTIPGAKAIENEIGRCAII
jgi:hypothetical protein